MVRDWEKLKRAGEFDPIYLQLEQTDTAWVSEGPVGLTPYPALCCINRRSTRGLSR